MPAWHRHPAWIQKQREVEELGVTFKVTFPHTIEAFDEHGCIAGIHNLEEGLTFIRIYLAAYRAAIRSAVR